MFFLVPTAVSFYFSLTRWTLFDSEFIGLDNFTNFLHEPALDQGADQHPHLRRGHLRTQGRARHGDRGAADPASCIARGYLRSVVFFPVLVSAVGVGPHLPGAHGPRGRTDQPDPRAGRASAVPAGSPTRSWALLSVALVDVWKGLGLAVVIYIAGITAIPQEYYEAASTDGAGAWATFRHIILPLSFPATSTVILLSLIGGLRSFDLIWAMTGGGPGFTSDVIGSVIYKQYQAGFYGLSTAGNVILFLLVVVIVFPLQRFLTKREVQL